jgi:hypothetical protein
LKKSKKEIMLSNKGVPSDASFAGTWVARSTEMVKLRI